MDAPLVTVRGSATREGPPDLATLSVTVHAAGPDADRVRAELAASAAAVRQVLDEHEFALEQTATTGLYIGPVFDPRKPTASRGYRGQVSTSVVVADLAALSPLVLALAALPQSEIDGPWWSLRRDNPLHREVRLDAIADARARAEDCAAAFGARLGALVEVSDLESGFQPVSYQSRGRAAMAADEPVFAFEPVAQTVSGQVTVRFALVT